MAGVLTPRSEARVLDRAEQKWLQEKWHTLDKSGDGSLDVHEVGLFLDSMRRNMSDADKKQAFLDMDTDGEGAIEFHEFYDWYSNQDGESFKGVMYAGAQKEFLGGVVMLGVFLFLPGVAIMTSMGIYEDGPDFAITMMLLLVTCGGLAAAFFYDAFGPVLDAQAQASQMKAYQMASGTGSGLVAMAHPKAAMKSANAKSKQKKADKKAAKNPGVAVQSNPLEAFDTENDGSESPRANTGSSEPAFEAE